MLRDLAAGREYDLCVSALYAEGGAAPPASRALGCVRFATAGGAPGCAAPRPHFLGGTVIIVIGAAIAASVLVFILILTARYKAARRPPAAAVASVCSQTNGAHRAPEPEPPPPPPPPVPAAPPALSAPGGARALFPSHSFPRRARTRRHGSLPRLDAPDALPPLRPSHAGSGAWPCSLLWHPPPDARLAVPLRQACSSRTAPSVPPPCPWPPSCSGPPC